MDVLSRIADWLGENEAAISAVVGIAALAGVLSPPAKPTRGRTISNPH
jgi:hypothetical protein